MLMAIGCTPEQTVTIIVNEKAHLQLDGKIPSNVFQTKANVPLDAGRSIGVYVVDATSGSTDSIHTTEVANKPMVVLTDGSISGDPIFLQEGKDYKVYSYSPRVTTVTDPREIPFAHGVDLLYADEATIVKALKGRNTVNLLYNHKLSQIKFKLIDDRDALTKEQYPFSEATFEVSGFYKDCLLNLETGKINRGEIDNNIKIIRQDFPVCFIPSTANMNLIIKVVIPGVITGEQIITGNISTLFESGHSYSFNIKVATTRLDVVGSLVDWIPVDEDVIITSM
jgi:hypothetical protein